MADDSALQPGHDNSPSQVDLLLNDAQSISLRKRRPHRRPDTSGSDPTPATAPAYPESPAALPTPSPQELSTAPRPRPRRPSRRPRKTSTSTKRSITFNIPVDQINQLRTFKTTSRLTSEQLLLRALAMLAPHATQAVADDLAESDPEAAQLAGTGGFTIDPQPHRGGALGQFGLRLLPDDIDRIDDLVQTSGAKDRGQLIYLALGEYLSAHVADQPPEDI